MMPIRPPLHKFAIVAIAIALIDVPVNGQRNIRESIVAVSATIVVRAPSYNPRFADRAIVYAETARQGIGVEIGIGNNTDQSLDIGTAATSWLQSMSLQISADLADRPRDISETLRAEVVGGVTSDILTIPPGQVRSARILLATRDGAPLTPGTYELSLRLDPTALRPLARQRSDILTRTVSFEIKEPSSIDEFADAYLQLAYDAKRKGQYADSREWAQRVLNIKPDSIPALLDVASSWLEGEGNCSEALPVYQRAVGLLRVGGDPIYRLHQPGREELIEAIEEHVSRRCGAAR